ncbi:MAG: hypothetical protein IKO35_00245 [Elusimicrobiaceae bacterium]|nr:hypothetical protein [Elusimicrobiaceae bacterium]
MFKKSAFIFVFLFSLAPANGAVSVSNIFEQALTLIPLELVRGRDVPFVGLQGQIPVKLSRQNPGAIAQYQAATHQIVFFKKPISKWLSQTKKQIEPAALPEILARCLAPVYVHELSHARDWQQAQQKGFIWPVTLEDEYIASFWQLQFMQQVSAGDSRYYAMCAPFLPPASYRGIPPCQAKETIYQTYVSQAGDALPPPLTRENIRNIQQRGRIDFVLHSFAAKRRHISVLSLFTKGGNWLQLTPQALAALEHSLTYKMYIAFQNQRYQEIQVFCVSF